MHLTNANNSMHNFFTIPQLSMYIVPNLYPNFIAIFIKFYLSICQILYPNYLLKCNTIFHRCQPNFLPQLSKIFITVVYQNFAHTPSPVVYQLLPHFTPSCLPKFCLILPQVVYQILSHFTPSCLPEFGPMILPPVVYQILPNFPPLSTPILPYQHILVHFIPVVYYFWAAIWIRLNKCRIESINNSFVFTVCKIYDLFLRLILNFFFDAIFGNIENIECLKQRSIETFCMFVCCFICECIWSPSMPSVLFPAAQTQCRVQ